MIQVNRIYLIFNRLVTKKFLVDTSVFIYQKNRKKLFLHQKVKESIILKAKGLIYKSKSNRLILI